MAIKAASRFEHAINRAGTNRHDAVVEPTNLRSVPEGESAITVEWMGVVIIEDRLFLPLFEPPVAWDLAVVLVGLAVATFPIMELARAEPQPAQQTFGGQFRALRPVVDVVDDFVARVVGNPASL